jgi:hypothetical protein
VKKAVLRAYITLCRATLRVENKDNPMIKRTYRVLLIVIMSGMMAACCCVYTSSGTLLMDTTAGSSDTDAAVPSASR